MTQPALADEDLLAYVDEQLPVDASAALEARLRDDPALRQRLSRLIAERDQGGPTLGEIWRRRRASCPPRATWAAYLAGGLGDGLREYLRFHLETVGCRCCAANLADLQATADPAAEQRARKIFATSLGRLESLPPLAADAQP